MLGAQLARSIDPTGYSSAASAGHSCRCMPNKTVSFLEGVAAERVTSQKVAGGLACREQDTVPTETSLAEEERQGQWSPCTEGRQGTAFGLRQGKGQRRGSRKEDGANRKGLAEAARSGQHTQADFGGQVGGNRGKAEWRLGTPLPASGFTRISATGDSGPRRQGDMEQDAKANTKQLHRLVSQQGSARRELQSIYKMRDTFLLEWNSYICQLCTLVEKQLQAKAATLQELDQAEEAWQTQLAQATSSIAQASGVVPTPSVETGEPIDLETEQEDAEQAVANAAAEASKKRKMLAELELQEKSISAALAQARTAANESVEALRERTPRRGAKADGKDFP